MGEEINGVRHNLIKACPPGFYVFMSRADKIGYFLVTSTMPFSASTLTQSPFLMTSQGF